MKFCYSGVNAILADYNTRPPKKAAMTKVRDEELPALKEKHKQFLKARDEIETRLSILEGDISDYGDVLKLQTLDVLLAFIKRNTAL